MNKSQFLKQLRYRLEDRLPAEELADVLSYYEAYFDDSEEDEETVAERLGSPASVAEQVLKDAGESARRVTTPPPAPAGRRRWVVPLIIAIVVGIILVIFVLPSALLLGLRTDSSLTPTHDIIDLPHELYIVCPEFASKNVGRSSTGLRFDFNVDEPMELSLDVRNLNGSLSLGIQDREDESWPYEKRAFTTQQDTDSVTLQPGSYSVVIDADCFQGSWHILGQSLESSEPAGSNQDVSVTLTPFEALDVDVAVASVQIKTGSEWTISLVNRSQDTSEDSYQLNYRNRDGVLSVRSTPYPSDVPSAQRSADVLVEVTVPEGTTLDRAELAIGVGDLVWEDCAVSGRLNVESGVGDVTLKLAAPVEETDILTGTGDLTLEIADSQSDYSWLLSSDTGDIRLNGETMPPFWSEGGSGERTLSLVSGTGDVSLAFQ